MTHSINVSRRDFLATSGGLVLGFMLGPRLMAASPQDQPWKEMPTAFFNPPPAKTPDAFIRIGSDDTVTFLIPRSEMGQGPTTACSQMLAEELECDWAKVRMEIAPVDPDLYGLQSTVGSLAVRTTWDPLRRVGAEAREMLVQAAAQRWNVSPSACRAEERIRYQDEHWRAPELWGTRGSSLEAAGSNRGSAEGPKRVHDHRPTAQAARYAG